MLSDKLCNIKKAYTLFFEDIIYGNNLVDVKDVEIVHFVNINGINK